MGQPAAQKIRTCLGDLDSGDSSVAERLIPLIYDELRVLAEQYMKRERPGHTLQPTALVHEAFLRLASGPDLRPESRCQFMAIAARAIRQVLIDHARGHGARKRGGDWQRITLDSRIGGGPPTDPIDLIALDAAMHRLAALSERQATIVELRFFGGLTVEEVADALDLSPRTVKGDWRVARAWLWRELGSGAVR